MRRILIVGDGQFAQTLYATGGAFLSRIWYRDMLEGVREHRPDVMIFASHLVEKEMAHEHEGVEAAIAAGQAATIARGMKIPLMVISNSFVFSQAEPARDTDHPNPAQAYGLAMSWIEAAALRLYRHVTVVRVGDLFGLDLESYPSMLAESPMLHVPHRTLVSPVYDVNAAEIILTHARHDSDMPRVAHVSTEDEPTTWFDFCRLMFPCGKGSVLWGVSAWTPRQMGLVPTAGWEVGSSMRQASRFLQALELRKKK